MNQKAIRGSFAPKVYVRELGGAMVAYAAVLVASILFLQGHEDVNGPLRDLIALSPMLPAALGLWVILRHLRRLDELQARVQMEAFGFAFACTAFVSLGYGFLEGVGYPRLSMFVVWGLMCGLWIIGLQLAARRYR
ncbi:hypothetical protein RQP53_24165 [Paucibacter sp. APW11]|uniref:DUF2069 domain-containing protein n=1 Tax=Roseateles aquae TaxID=3077235 RepID=A0ABU3PJU7_9BURK|nr:hypothetical protein [Paucibacter sp. APW11]MDT9002398.1 hypothetical protein [Paucibacter sp. APW11]